MQYQCLCQEKNSRNAMYRQIEHLNIFKLIFYAFDSSSCESFFTVLLCTQKNRCFTPIFRPFIIFQYQAIKKLRKKRKQSATQFFFFLSIILKAHIQSRPVFPNTFVAKLLNQLDTQSQCENVFEETPGGGFIDTFPSSIHGSSTLQQGSTKAAVILALHSSFHTYTNTSIGVSIPKK